MFILQLDILATGWHFKGCDYRFSSLLQVFLTFHVCVCVCVLCYVACWISQDLFARNPTQTKLKPTKGNVLAHLLALSPLLEATFLPFNH